MQPPNKSYQLWQNGTALMTFQAKDDNAALRYAVDVSGMAPSEFEIYETREVYRMAHPRSSGRWQTEKGRTVTTAFDGSEPG